MTATKADIKKSKKQTYNPAAKPPVRLSREDQELLKNLTPNSNLMKYVAELPKLRIIDGATCGL